MGHELPAGAVLHPAVIALAPLPGPRRATHIVAHVQLGPVVAVFAVAGLKRRQMQLRAPLAVDGAAGILLPDDLKGAVEMAILDAIHARPELRRHLLDRR
jgi:hypothetical protein